MMRGCFIILMVLFIAPVANGALTINEIMYAPSSEFGGTYNEWVEIYNSGNTEVNLSGWVFMELSKNHSFSGSIGPSKYIILSRMPENFTQYYSTSSKIIETKFMLNDDGEELALKNADGIIVDSIAYTPVGNASKKGKTLERNGSDWLESAALGGTPGAQNSVIFGVPPVQTPVNETENTTNTTPPVNTTEEETNIPNIQQNQESDESAGIEILAAPDAMKFGEYSAIRARFKSGSKTFQKARFAAYIYKPSWIARDINANETTLRNSPYNSNAAAEISEIASNETYYIVLPLFLKCNTGGYANTTYTARVRAYTYENSEWRALAESDRNIFVFGESETCKKEIAKETTCINKTIEKNCTEKILVLRDAALEINATYPEIIFAGENFTTNVFIKNNGETLRDIEIYSYLYEHSQIISSGFDGAKWGNARAANNKKITLYGGNSTTIELISRARENTTAEKYTYKVRFDDLNDDKKSEERIYLIELAARNTSELQDIKNETISNSTEAKNKITGNLLAEKTKLQNLSFLDRIIYKIKSWLM